MTDDVEDLDYLVALPDDTFEGPLDLLLHLVKRHELDIFDIPISFITEKYLQMIEAMRALDMDVAGEYLLMAATLAHIKSRELLPKEEKPEEVDGDEEEGDPRLALIKRLLEYQKYKAAAEEISQRPVVGRNVWGRGASPLAVASGDIDTQGPLEEIPMWDLIEVLEQVLSRSKGKFTYEVTADRLSLADTIQELTDRLEQEEAFTFESCFMALLSADGVINLRGQVVITFMAILEMARLRLLRFHQPQLGASIYITRPGSVPPAAGGSDTVAANHEVPS